MILICTWILKIVGAPTHGRSAHRIWDPWQSHPLRFSVRQLHFPSVCQLQRQAVVCQQSHHLWFSVCLSVCQLQRYQEMTEFYDVNFLAPTILNAPNKIFGPKLAHSSSTTCYQNFVYKLFDYKIEHLQPMQTSPITFMTIFEALRLILAPQHISYLILISLRILKWG